MLYKLGNKQSTIELLKAGNDHYAANGKLFAEALTPIAES